MNFAVILDKNFRSLHDAKDAVNTLPAYVAAKAQIVTRRD